MKEKEEKYKIYRNIFFYEYIDIFFVGEFIPQEFALNFLDFLLESHQRKKTFMLILVLLRNMFISKRQNKEIKS